MKCAQVNISLEDVKLGWVDLSSVSVAHYMIKGISAIIISPLHYKQRYILYFRG